MEYEETNEDKMCPWDYGSRENHFEDDQDNNQHMLDEDVNEDSESSWSEREKSFEIDSSMKRPGGTILRFIPKLHI